MANGFDSFVEVGLEFERISKSVENVLAKGKALPIEVHRQQRPRENPDEFLTCAIVAPNDLDRAVRDMVTLLQT